MIKAAEVKGLMLEKRIMTTIGSEIYNSFIDEQGAKTLRLDREKTLDLISQAIFYCPYEILKVEEKEDTYKLFVHFNTQLGDLLIAE